MNKRLFFLLGFLFVLSDLFAQDFFVDSPGKDRIIFSSPGQPVTIYVDLADYEVVKKSAELLKQDIMNVTGTTVSIVNSIPERSTSLIVIGSSGQSAAIAQLVKQKKLSTASINKWEAYQIKTITNPFKGIQQALIINGNDRRGTAFAVFEISKQLGVSPWYWWADVPIKKRKTVYLNKTAVVSDFPKVKYRGIFINDEAPALSGWSKEKFGGFNHLFYEKVFELMLRLKSNYIWPAMWGNAFYDDDSLNIKTADDYAIVIGTSHHEPLMRAHDEWRRYGQGKWNYDSNEVRLKEFWRNGIKRATNEKIVSIGMRGDGDEPMSRETATALLERIVADQRKIIEDVTGKSATETPQLWALYKEVQDYYDKGMRVPDDVTLLLCDDNWGNIRKLPKLDDKPRKGGYGIYYHFDYVGGPRNYKWVNTNPIPRVWEQMHLAWEYNTREIWIVNVGDIKPMEFPISFFLDYAWNPPAISADQLQSYTQKWCEQQFGKTYAKEIAVILAKYAKYNGRRKPELLNEKTYALYEGERVMDDYNKLLGQARIIGDKLDPQYRDAYNQLVLHPVWACANLQEMYTMVAFNHFEYARKTKEANEYADKAKQLYIQDSLISHWYNHEIAKGKWNHMMDQTHIGYTYWQQPVVQVMPVVRYVPTDSIVVNSLIDSLTAVYNLGILKNANMNTFYQLDRYVSIGAAHFSKAVNAKGIGWKVLPDHGREADAITSFPVTSASQKPGNNSPQLAYDIYVLDTGKVNLNCYFSPTLNFHNTTTGLQYAVSIDNEPPQIVSINREDNNGGIWNRWVANNIIIKTTSHRITKPGKHVIKYWLVNPGVVLQKLVLYWGDLPYSYLGPPETKN